MSVVGLVESIAAVEWGAADRDAVAGVLADVRRVRGWLDSVEIRASRRLAELATACPSMFPEQVAAEAGRVSLITRWCRAPVFGRQPSRVIAAVGHMSAACSTLL